MDDLINFIRKNGLKNAEKIWNEAVKTAPMSYSDWWHKLEKQMYDQFEIELFDVDDSLFSVMSYWEFCKDSPKAKQIEMMEEVIHDFENILEHLGEDVLVPKHIDF